MLALMLPALLSCLRTAGLWSTPQTLASVPKAPASLITAIVCSAASAYLPPCSSSAQRLVASSHNLTRVPCCSCFRGPAPVR